MRCPVSLAIFVDPVIAEDQQTYERSTFEQLCVECAEEFNVSGEVTHFLSPITREHISATVCIANLALRDVVTRSIAAHGSLLSAEELEDYNRREKVRTINIIKAKIDKAMEIEGDSRIIIDELYNNNFEEEEVVWYALRGITNIYVCDMEHGLLPSVLDAMVNHNESSRVQQYGARVLQRISAMFPECKDDLEDRICLLVKALKAFPANVLVAKETIRALASLAENVTGAQVNIKDTGAIDTIFLHMSHWCHATTQEHLRIQRDGCSLFREMALNKNTRAAVAKWRGLIVHVRGESGLDYEIQSYTRDALDALDGKLKKK